MHFRQAGAAEAMRTGPFDAQPSLRKRPGESCRLSLGGCVPIRADLGRRDTLTSHQGSHVIVTPYL